MMVIAAPECGWTASSAAPWIRDLAPAAGQGSGRIEFQVSANAAAAERHADIVVNDMGVRITQQAAGCAFDVTPGLIEVGETGGVSAVEVRAPIGCTWSPVPDHSWIAVIPASTRASNGSFDVQVTTNVGAARSGTISVGGQQVTVRQAGPSSPPPSCSYAIDPSSRGFDADGGVDRTNVDTQAGCAWTASSGVSWVRIANGGAGTGPGPVIFSVEANSGPARQGVLNVAGRSLSIQQSAVADPAPSPTPPAPPSPSPAPPAPPASCSYSVAPAGHAISWIGGALETSVTTGTSCPWTASTSASWMSFTSAVSGSGTGSVAFAVAANTGAARSGTVSIAGQTVTVSQAASCQATVAPLEFSVDRREEKNLAVTVTIPAGCAWTAASQDSWLEITKGSSGQGDGQVVFKVAANRDEARTGHLLVAGQTISVTQSAR